MTRATPRRRNSRPTPRRRPVRRVSAVAAAVVGGRAGRRRGRASGTGGRCAPNFAADNVVAGRRADRRRRGGGGFDIGYDGCAQGRDAHRVGVGRQRRSHAPPAGRPWAVAARATRLSRRRAAGAGAQRRRGYDAGRGVCRVRRGRISLRYSIIGVRTAATRRWWRRSWTRRCGILRPRQRWRRWTRC